MMGTERTVYFAPGKFRMTNKDDATSEVIIDIEKDYMIKYNSNKYSGEYYKKNTNVKKELNIVAPKEGVIIKEMVVN